MTAQTTERARPSRVVAAEVRATLGRLGITQSELARRLNQTGAWVSTRISPTASVDMTLDEIARMAEALNVPVQGLLAGWLPRLDSNQQPSGYVSALARAAKRWGLAA